MMSLAHEEKINGLAKIHLLYEQDPPPLFRTYTAIVTDRLLKRQAPGVA